MAFRGDRRAIVNAQKEVLATKFVGTTDTNHSLVDRRFCQTRSHFVHSLHVTDPNEVKVCVALSLARALFKNSLQQLLQGASEAHELLLKGIVQGYVKSDGTYGMLSLYALLVCMYEFMCAVYVFYLFVRACEEATTWICMEGNVCICNSLSNSCIRS